MIKFTDYDDCLLAFEYIHIMKINRFSLIDSDTAHLWFTGQWAVEEKAAADLMLNFHRSLNGNINESVSALRRAQLEALKRPAPFNHPVYWSAFVAVEGPQR